MAAAAPDAAAVRARMPQVEALVLAEMQRQKIPGVAVGIVSHGEVIAGKGYGHANIELAVPVQADTVFQSGSLGKQFTAVAVMLQVQAGRLRLDDPLTKYFTGAPDSWRAITVRNLLNHTSGISDYTDEHDGKAGVDYRRDYTEEQLTKLAYTLPLQFPPGSKWHYSNTGYLLLGALIRKVSGRFYGDILNEQVFAPLQMNSARIISEADIVQNRAAGYRLVKGELKNQEWVAPSLNTTADGALYLSVQDFIAWDRGLRAGAILRPESWAEVYRPATLSGGRSYPYGFGWVVATWNGKPWYHHSGAWQGFETYITRYLADDLTLVVLTNLADCSPERVADGIAQLIDKGLPRGEEVADPGASATQ
jgi:CubicO group peptidase (beta-lactamase class C family)